MTSSQQSQNGQNIKDIRKVMEYGVFLETITLAIHFCVRSKKTDLVNKIREFYQSFESTLSNEEKSEFYAQVGGLIEKKFDSFLVEAKNSFKEEEIKSLLSDLANDFLAKTPQDTR